MNPSAFLIFLPLVISQPRENMPAAVQTSTTYMEVCEQCLLQPEYGLDDQQIIKVADWPTMQLLTDPEIIKIAADGSRYPMILQQWGMGPVPKDEGLFFEYDGFWFTQYADK